MPDVTETTPDPAFAAGRSPARRRIELIAGLLLVLITPPVALLPGPGGTIVFAGGMILILRNSLWARQRWARLKLRFPRVGGFVDRMMRRGSALRRHARDKQTGDGQTGDGQTSDGQVREN